MKYLKVKIFRACKTARTNYRLLVFHFDKKNLLFLSIYGASSGRTRQKYM